MKRRKHRLRKGSVPEDLIDPFSHLLGSFVCERYGENGIRRHASLLDEIGDAMRNHARLARASTCQQKDRSIDRSNSLLLLGIHIF